VNTDFDFWEARFRKDGKVWGEDPSPSAAEAVSFFRDFGARNILVPGCSYGRHCLLFAKEGFAVTGFDVALSALYIARDWLFSRSVSAALVRADARWCPFAPGSFEGAYLFNVLHFFLREDRTRVLNELCRVLVPGAPIVLCVFSDSDPGYGRGLEVEPGTFDARSGRPAHFFSEASLLEQLSGFRIARFQKVEESESHGGKQHVHVLWTAWVLTPVDPASPVAVEFL